MPVRRHPRTLKLLAFQSVIDHFEMICYGRKFAKGTKALATYIDKEGYKAVSGPFSLWPTGMLQDLLEALYRYCSSIKTFIYFHSLIPMFRHRCGHQHLLHCVIQPQMTHCSILQHGSIHVAMTLISERCCTMIKVLELNNSKNVPAGFYCGYFKKFSNITR
jgi:hypothetical protein